MCVFVMCVCVCMCLCVSVRGLQHCCDKECRAVTHLEIVCVCVCVCVCTSREREIFFQNELPPICTVFR